MVHRLEMNRKAAVTYRTDVATLKEKGAWKDVDAETRRTDCVASETGPSLTTEGESSIQSRKSVQRDLQTGSH